MSDDKKAAAMPSGLHTGGRTMVERSTPDWVKPGASVIFCTISWGRLWGPTAKIEKVYKTGNFTLEGLKGQYRPHGDSASKTGAGAWDRTVIHPLTDAIRAEVAADKRFTAAKHALRDEVGRLEALLRANGEESIIAAADEIAGRTDSSILPAEGGDGLAAARSPQTTAEPTT